MRKSPKWNGRFRKLMENGRLIHKFFPIGSVCIEISTLFKSICMEISQFYKYFGRLFDTLYQTTFDVCVLFILYWNQTELEVFWEMSVKTNLYVFLLEVFCTILFTENKILYKVKNRLFDNLSEKTCELNGVFALSL